MGDDEFYEKKSIKNILEDYENYSQKYKNDKLAVCMVEISDLKFYNYIFGYEESYILFQSILKKVKGKLQDKFFVIEFIGYRFLVLACKLKSNDMDTIEKNILEICKEKLYIKNREIAVNMRIGTSFYPDDSQDLLEVLRYSDIALSYAKGNNKIEHAFFEKFMYDKILRKQIITSEIKDALNKKELTLFYQPQVDLKTMRVYGVEALIRWKHPVYGIISPGYFIDIIEQNGMINDVGKFVIYEACRQLKQWHTCGYPNIYMSINISENQINGEAFLNFVKFVLDETKVDANFLIFDVACHDKWQKCSKKLAKISLIFM